MKFLVCTDGSPRSRDTMPHMARLGIRADAIAMATHGHSALRHLVAGSTALGVLANSELPVILVKSHPSEWDPGTPDVH